MAELTEPVPVTPVPAAPTSLTPDPAQAVPVEGGTLRAWRTLRRNPFFWVGSAIVCGLVLVAVLAPVLAPYDPYEQFRDAITATGDPAGPSARFPLGTDPTGRDYLSRLMYGARTSLLIGVGANVIAVVLGLLVGSVAALAASPSIPVGAGVASGSPWRACSCA